MALWHTIGTVRREEVSQYQTLRKLHRIALEQDLRCAYCSEPFGNYVDEANPTLDHVVPQAKGGSNDPSNLVAACARCNHAKGDMSVEAFCALIDAGGLRARRKLRLPLGRFEPPQTLRAKLLRANIEAAQRQKPKPPPKGPKVKKLAHFIAVAREWDEDRFVKKETPYG